MVKFKRVLSGIIVFGLISSLSAGISGAAGSNASDYTEDAVFTDKDGCLSGKAHTVNTSALTSAGENVTVILKVNGTMDMRTVEKGDDLIYSVQGCEAIENADAGVSEIAISADRKTVTVKNITETVVVEIVTVENHILDKLVSVEVAPSCVDTGIGTYSCSVCSAEISGVVIPATGEHINIPQTGAAPDDGENPENWIKLTCSGCGAVNYRYILQGNIVKDSAVIFAAGTRYFDKDGYMVTGLYTFGNGREAVFAPSGMIEYGWLRVDGRQKYYLDGDFVKGVYEIDGRKYMFSGVTGTLITNSVEILTDEETVKAVYFGSDGALCEEVSVADNVNGSWVSIAGRTMYVKDGKYYKGKHTIGDNWYYFNSAGRRLENTEETVDGTAYFFDSEGIPTEIVTDGSGFATVNGKEILVLDGRIVKSEFAEKEGRKYYFNTVGRKLKDTIEIIDGVPYLFDIEGVATEITEDGLYSTGNKTMRVVDGAVLKNVWYGNEYYNSVGRRLEKIAEVIDGVLVEFGSDGQKLGEVKLNDGTTGFSNALNSGRTVYLENGQLKTGWIEVNGDRYFANSAYRILRDTAEVIDGVFCVFDKDGKLTSETVLSEHPDEFIEIEGRLIYIDLNGEIVKSGTATRTVDGETFTIYINSMYRVLRNTVSVADGKLYEFDKDGRATITVLEERKGKMPYPTDTGRVIYVNEYGEICIGLVTIGEDIYHFNSCYRMDVNTVLYLNGAVYEFGSDGKGQKISDVTLDGNGMASLGNGINLSILPEEGYVNTLYFKNGVAQKNSFLGISEVSGYYFGDDYYMMKKEDAEITVEDTVYVSDGYGLFTKKEDLI